MDTLLYINSQKFNNNTFKTNLPSYKKSAADVSIKELYDIYVKNKIIFDGYFAIKDKLKELSEIKCNDNLNFIEKESLYNLGRLCVYLEFISKLNLKYRKCYIIKNLHRIKMISEV